MIVSTEIILEYEEILERKYGHSTTSAFLELLYKLPNVSHVHKSYSWNLISDDPDDNKYCDCAIAGSADYLVTEDKHFALLDEISFPKLRVLSIDRFLNILQLV